MSKLLVSFLCVRLCEIQIIIQLWVENTLHLVCGLFPLLAPRGRIRFSRSKPCPWAVVATRWRDLFLLFPWSHDDVIKWNHFPRYWHFTRGILRSPVKSPHKGQWRGALMFSLICPLNKRLSKQWWDWRFETPLYSLWHHCNVWVGNCAKQTTAHINDVAMKKNNSIYFTVWYFRLRL